MNTEIYRLISSDDKGTPAPAHGLVDTIVADIKAAKRSKLIILSGVAGSGKTLVSDAVVEEMLKDGTLHHDNFYLLSTLTNGNERPNALTETIAWSQANLNAQAVDDSAVGVVIWDEVRYIDTELDEIERLLKEGYVVIALDQNHDKLKTFERKGFEANSEYRLA